MNGHPARSINIAIDNKTPGGFSRANDFRGNAPGVEGLRGGAWTAGARARADAAAVLPQDGFHAVFDEEFAFLEADFFELLVVCEVMPGFQLVESIVE
jgi:hypothetical protein